MSEFGGSASRNVTKPEDYVSLSQLLKPYWMSL